MITHSIHGSFRPVTLMSTQPRLFKYLSPNGAKKTLATGTVRLSIPANFNDPFDMRLDEILGLDFKQFAEQQKLALLDLLDGKLDPATLRSSKLGKVTALINAAMRNASPDQRKAVKDEFLATPLDELYDFERVSASRNELIAKLQNGMSRYGVFCVTLRCDSLLMWSHYAQGHEGALLEFVPDVSKDSAFLASKPVRYAKERPLIYRTPSDLVRRALMMSAEASAGEILNDLIFTKSLEWEYEQEYRLAIPNFVPEGGNFASLDYGPNELVALYLGCRVTQPNKDELVQLARARNGAIEVYQAKVSSREYALTFDPI